jgi:hypothetical protein
MIIMAATPVAMRKLSLDSTAALVRYAVRNKIVEP